MDRLESVCVHMCICACEVFAHYNFIFFELKKIGFLFSSVVKVIVTRNPLSNS